MQSLVGCVQERLASTFSNMFYKARSCEVDSLLGPWYQDLVEVLHPVWGLFVSKF